MFGLGCFWGAEKQVLEDARRLSTAVGYAGGYTPNPTYHEVCSGRTGHAEAVRVVFDPAKDLLRASCCKLFWESHDPTQGMRQGNDVGTQYRSAIYTYGDEQKKAAEASRDAYQQRAVEGRLRRDHDRDRRGAGVLLRRGLPPAVPRQEPQRLLPGPLDRHRLPGRAGRARAGAGHGSRRRLMSLRVGSIVIRVDDLEKEAAFWTAALDYVRRGPPTTMRRSPCSSRATVMGLTFRSIGCARR